MRPAFSLPAFAATALALLAAAPAHADDRVRAVVDAAARPVMEEHGIPGLSVALLVGGERHIFHYGVASRETGRPVDEQTLFEIGSLSKPFTGTLGARLAAEAAGGTFAELLETKVLEPLALNDTFLAVPNARRADYAQGYTRDGDPVRVNPGLFDGEAYGIKTTAGDFLRFVEASASAAADEPALAQALRTARSGVYRVEAMHQGLGWELYPAPARLTDLLQGADPRFVLEPNAVEPVEAPVTAVHAVGTVSKTGSTGGFGAYALFSPSAERRS